jgi:hypothetical protein
VLLVAVPRVAPLEAAAEVVVLSGGVEVLVETVVEDLDAVFEELPQAATTTTAATTDTNITRHRITPHLHGLLRSSLGRRRGVALGGRLPLSRR